MKTAQEMYNYALTNNYLSSKIKESIALSSFEIIENNLENDEDVMIAFTSFGIYVNDIYEMGGTVYVAFTNKQTLIYAQKSISQSNIKKHYIPFVDEINKLAHGLSKQKIELKTEELHIIFIQNDSIKNSLFYNLNLYLESFEKNTVENEEVEEIIKPTKEEIFNLQIQNTPLVIVDNINQLKELRISGVLSEEEYNIRKKQLLGL